MQISGLQALTLLDFPGKVACTVFTQGCNLRCRFCHNKGLIPCKISSRVAQTNQDTFEHLIDTRHDVLDGVAVTGGEPLLQPDISEFLKRIKDLGLLVKLDTNGTHPEKLQELVESHLVDYVAVDVKNCISNYSSAMIESYPYYECRYNQKFVQRTIDYLLTSPVEYEFRTTVVKGIHTETDLLTLAKSLQGCSRYYLQTYKYSHYVLDPVGLEPFTTSELNFLLDRVRAYIPHAELRGV